MSLAEDNTTVGSGGFTTQGRVRLRTLLYLRWLAIAGQTAAVLVTAYALGFSLPLGATLAVIAFSAWVNVFLMVTRPGHGLVPEWEAAAQLAFDVVQLAVLLALTGGIQNPFLLLFIAPVAVSASVLRPAVTAGLAALSYVCIGALALWYMPLPWYTDQTFSLPPIYQAGLAGAVLIGLGFTSVYAWRVSAEEERLNVALAAVQAILAREQQLSALGGLAAAAAHELGTPLATIHLVAKDLAKSAPADSALAEDAQLLVSQSERCREILRQLNTRRPATDAVHERMPLQALLEEAAGPHRGLGRDIILTVEGGQTGPELQRRPEIIQGLRNLIENAVGFAETKVEIIARFTPVEIEVTVRDDGPGFSPAVLSRLGEPYVSERSAGQTGGGLGLGFFIAKTLLERSGARVEVRNRQPPNQGAVVRAMWPRGRIEIRPNEPPPR